MNKRKKRQKEVLYDRLALMITSIMTLILLVMCVILFRKVHVLEKQVEELAGKSTMSVIQPMTWPDRPQAQTEEEKETESMTTSVEATVTASETTSATESETESQTETEAEPETTTEPETELLDEADRKKIYLTFDDGPSKNTNEILDILKKYNIKATFFVTGKTDEASKAAYRRIVEEGHTLGMHSYSHAYDEIYASEEAFMTDLMKLQNYLYEETGVVSKYYRFPGGSSNTISKINMQEFIACLHEYGVEYFDWNVSSGDGTSNVPDTETMIDNVMRDAVKYEHSVVLLHDDAYKNQTVASLEALIETLLEQQCMILPIDETVEPVQHLRPE